MSLIKRKKRYVWPVGKAKGQNILNGQLYQTNQFGVIEVIHYHGAANVVVQFRDETKYRMKTTTTAIHSGEVRNPLAPTVFGFGFVGVGKYKSCRKCSKTGRHLNTSAYNSWYLYMKSCYDAEYDGARPKLIEEFNNFQVYAEHYFNPRGLPE